jgi:alpha-mannosidase
MLGWKRSDIAEVDVPFSDPGVEEFALLDSDGRTVPFQFSKMLRNDYGGIRQAHIAFLAREIPALGYAVYHAVPNVAAPPGEPEATHDTTREDHGDLENEFYRASFNLWNGDMTNLVLKQDNWESLATPGNVVAREYDGGDFWELYGTLNGGRFTAMKRPILAPRANYTQWSSDFVGGGGSIHSGPVFSEFHITHPLGKNQFRTTVRMYRGLQRIDISTELTNQEEFVRYRALFPTTIHNGKAMHEIPFGAIERPERQEFPAQNWIDYSDGAHGLSLINQGLPGNNVTDGKLMLSLMRSARLISYGFIGGYEPGVGSDTGLGLGKTYKLNYAVIPHAGDWRSGRPWRAGLEFNNPLIVRTVAPHPGELPAKWGLVEVPGADVVVSALKPSKAGGAVLRVYEAAGQPSPSVRANWNTNIGDVHEVNLIEDPGRSIAAQRRSFEFDLKPYEIKTFRVHLETQTAEAVPTARH